MLYFILTIVVLFLLTRRWGFWGWIGSRSFGQLMGFSLGMSTLVWCIVQATGFGA